MYVTSICLHWQCAFCSEYCNGNYLNVSNSVYQFMDLDVLQSCITQNLCLWPIPYIVPSCVRKSWPLCWLKNFSFVSSCLSSAYKCCNVLHILIGSYTESFQVCFEKKCWVQCVYSCTSACLHKGVANYLTCFDQTGLALNIIGLFGFGFD